jgi:hypothetical protein
MMCGACDTKASIRARKWVQETRERVMNQEAANALLRLCPHQEFNKKVFGSSTKRVCRCDVCNLA